jgi:hypothetical protein
MKTGKRTTTPGEVISPLEHSHGESELSEPGEKLGTLNQSAPQKGKTSAQRSAKERLEKAPEDKREITIGPTTKTGPDIIIERG